MSSKRSEISQIILRNGKDTTGQWMDLHISIGSWVTMRPKQCGHHAVKKRKLNELTSHWKAQVLGFITSQGGKCVDQIIVAHAYGAQDMMKEDISKASTFPKLDVNCLSSSDFKDRVSAQSITSVLEVHHYVIGKLLFPDYAPSYLKAQGIWFHKYHYTKQNKVGKLTIVDAPTLSLLCRGISEMHTVTAFRLLLTREVAKLMTERGGIRGGVKAFIPIHIFAFMFKDVETLRVAPQTYTFKGVREESLDQLFYGQWRIRTHETGGQITKCEVDCSSFIFRYRLPKQTLYCNFFVERHKRQWENNKYVWIAVEEHRVKTNSMELSIHTENGSVQILNVEEEWTLTECRKLLESLTGYSEFHFLLDDKKVGYRRECSVTCKDCMVPHLVRIKHDI